MKGINNHLREDPTFHIGQRHLHSFTMVDVFHKDLPKVMLVRHLKVKIMLVRYLKVKHYHHHLKVKDYHYSLEHIAIGLKLAVRKFQSVHTLALNQYPDNGESQPLHALSQTAEVGVLAAWTIAMRQTRDLHYDLRLHGALSRYQTEARAVVRKWCEQCRSILFTPRHMQK